ncbi:hypothetical protein BIY23_04075 [Wolbachia pipientis]|uniref:Uncharacterized protein n=2 Tax=Wolbachia pipientis TaxID=955 RepID=A0A1E7QJ19_WOLPI|nr:hypothetical protein BIY23_04075 [Wolbachia pipientis]
MKSALEPVHNLLRSKTEGVSHTIAMDTAHISMHCSLLASMIPKEVIKKIADALATIVINGIKLSIAASLEP